MKFGHCRVAFGTMGYAEDMSSVLDCIHGKILVGEAGENQAVEPWGFGSRVPTAVPTLNIPDEVFFSFFLFGANEGRFIAENTNRPSSERTPGHGNRKFYFSFHFM
jgi:hypothetical protein